MRIIAFVLASCVLAACALPELIAGQGNKSDAGVTADGGGDAGPAVTGLGCGAEIETGIPLCVATSACPTVVIDGQAFPTCGFRIRGSVVDLVCACGTQICAMGAYTTCAQAAQLLTSQTYQSVCAQVSEGRCVEAQGTGPTPSTCDRQCLQQCGGGAGCAALCNCR